MSEPIISIERIQEQAFKAARLYANINDACPYPFGTEAGRVFKEHFLWARGVMALNESEQKKEVGQ